MKANDFAIFDNFYLYPPSSIFTQIVYIQEKPIRIKNFVDKFIPEYIMNYELQFPWISKLIIIEIEL